MKKNLIFLSVLCMLVLSFSPAIAQDLITYRDGKEVKAIVSRIGKGVISYRRYDDTTGVSYFLDTRFVEKIQFASGETRQFEPKEDFPVPEQLLKRTVSTNVFGLFAGSINVRYQKLQGTGRIGLFIESGIGLSPETVSYYNYTEENRSYLSVWGITAMRSQFYVNPGIYFYTPELGPLRVGTGFSLFFGVYKAIEYTNYSQQSGTPTSKALSRLMWNTRLDLNLSDHISIYTEGELSLITTIFEQSIVHIGFAVSF